MEVAGQLQQSVGDPSDPTHLPTGGRRCERLFQRVDRLEQLGPTATHLINLLRLGLGFGVCTSVAICVGHTCSLDPVALVVQSVRLVQAPGARWTAEPHPSGAGNRRSSPRRAQIPAEVRDREGNPPPLSAVDQALLQQGIACLLYTSPSPRDGLLSRM